MNPRPPGYEPDELPGCSTPRYEIGARAGIRTRDLSVISRVLWPTELPSHVELMTGLEPVTSSLPRTCSTYLSYISMAHLERALPGGVVQMGRLELPPGVVTRHGPEPCASANSATSAVLAEATGFEPAISAVTGPHVRPLHHASAYRGSQLCKRLRRSADALVHGRGIEPLTS